ncbi:MAG TPA: radical SAM protein [Anaerolineae bacterium]|nr:radical SAM protein [Anaerolineae bacterium]
MAIEHEEDHPPRYVNIGWTVGNYCNARCGHCYSWKVRKDSRLFLTPAEVEHIVDQLASLKVETVNLGGNEPIYTHGPDLRATLLPFIIQRLHAAGIAVGFTTNGVTFDFLWRHHRETLMKVNDIDFSLDSPFCQEHDDHRGAKLFHMVTQGIQRCVAMGIDCSVITVGLRTTFNQEYLSAFLQLTRLLGAEFRINSLKPIDSTLKAEMPTREQFYESFAFLLQNTHCVTLGESCLTALVGAGAVGCPCGHYSFRINSKGPDGKLPISPCVYLHDFRTGDLLTQDIHDIIHSPPFVAYRSRQRVLPRACQEANCAFLERCRGGCAARAYLTYGDMEARDPYCPQALVDQDGDWVSHFPQDLKIAHNGVRVHDNYLCTWIGATQPWFEHPRYPNLEAFEQVRPDSTARRPLVNLRQTQVGSGYAPIVKQAVDKR